MTENRQTSQHEQDRFPAHFDSVENISFNHRMLTLYLIAEKLTHLDGAILEVNFPWQSGLLSYAETNAFTRYSNQAMALISVLLEKTGNSEVIYLEVDHNRCLYSFASSQPQQLFNALQHMPCPAIFAAPAITQVDMSPSQYICLKRP
ncbi:hypothetical protein [Alteromonas sp. 14N.309.X.WAT.G.H12]|uniref:hypothetical protein n=1 Tax=Alteromonas sp. 14N.309.X.WAT.G.H12 TaxID=3120824 RepID=UPI002FD0FB50